MRKVDPKVYHKAREVFGDKLENLFSYQEDEEADDPLEQFLAENPEVCATSCDDAWATSAKILVIPINGYGAVLAFAPQVTTIANHVFLRSADDFDALIEALQEVRQSCGAMSRDAFIESYRREVESKGTE